MNIWWPADHVKHILITIKNICWLSNNASFGTFCVQIGQFFLLHWVCEDSIKWDILFLKQNPCHIKVSQCDSRNRQFWHKGHKKKPYSMYTYLCLQGFSKILFSVSCRSTNICSLHAYGVNWNTWKGNQARRLSKN